MINAQNIAAENIKPDSFVSAISAEEMDNSTKKMVSFVLIYLNKR